MGWKYCADFIQNIFHLNYLEGSFAFLCFFYACFYSSCPKPTTLHGNKCRLRTLLVFFFWLLNVVMVLYRQLSYTEVDLRNAVCSFFSDYQMQ